MKIILGNQPDENKNTIGKQTEEQSEFATIEPTIETEDREEASLDVQNETEEAEIQAESGEAAEGGDPKEPTMLFEDLSKREECAKHFRMSDGTYKAYFYGSPVHYYDETTNCFEEIDNTLELSADSESTGNFECYQNKRSALKVQFARNSNCASLMAMAKGEHKLAWKFVGRNAEQVACEGQIVECEQSEQTERGLAKSSESRAEDVTVCNANSEIRYNNIEPNIDIQYILNGAGVKENIIVSERRDCYEFVFKLGMENLQPRLAEDKKSIDFIAKKANEADESAVELTEKIIFNIPAPYMHDAAEEYSNDVSYELDDIGYGEYLLKVIADPNWINASERVFPVTIDPTVFTQNASVIRNVELNENTGRSATDKSPMRVGRNLPIIGSVQRNYPSPE